MKARLLSLITLLTFSVCSFAIDIDKTALVPTTWGGAPTAGAWAAPFVDTADGRTGVAMCENYNAGTAETTGVIISQTVTGLENGSYTLVLFANAMYTPDRGIARAEDMADGATDVAYVFANDEQTPVNAQNATGTSKNGEYTIEVEVTDGTLNMGIAKAKGGTNWHTIQIKSLTLHKVADITDEMVEELINEIPTGKMDASIASSLEEAKTALLAEASDANYTALANLISDAKASVNMYADAKKALDAQAKLINGTNVYGEGYEAYKSAWLANSAKYSEGTLTETVVNPNVTTGWRASTAYNFLLTPWTVGGEACNNFDKALYINTWSTEGETDGSNFLVPFFEYFIADAQSLGANTISTVITGLEPGKYYDANAWVRVRIKNNGGDTATGITLQAGNGEAVDVCAGEAIDTQFRVILASAQGAADEDGNLEVKFVVADGNNVHWLSFKDVTCKISEVQPDPDDLIPATVTIVLNEENKSIDVASDNAEFPLQVKSKLASEFEEGETPESIANEVVGEMNDAFATEEEFIEYFAAYTTKGNQEVSIDGIEEVFPGEQYVVFGYNVAWDKKEGKIVLASNVESYIYNIPAPEPEPEPIATLTYTAAVQGGSNEAGSSKNAETHYYNNWGTSGWAAQAYIGFDVELPNGQEITSATLTFTSYCGGTRDNRSVEVYGLSAEDSKNINIDALELSAVKGTKLASETDNRAESLKTIDVTEYIKSVAEMNENTPVAFMLGGAAAGAYLYGIASDKAPVLSIETKACAPKTFNTNFDTEGDWTTSGNIGLNPATKKEATEWTVSAGDSWAGIATFQIGSEATLNNAAVPALNAEGAAEGGVAGIAASWTSYASYQQSVTLPAGDYVLSYDAYEGNANAQESAVVKNLCGFIADNGTEYLSENKSYTYGEWTKHEIKFTLEEETQGVISVGYKSGNVTSNNTPKLFIDNVKIEMIPGVEVAIDELDKAIKAEEAALAAYSVGDAIFQYPESEFTEINKAIQDAKDAIADPEATKESVNDAKQNLEDAIAAFAPKMTAPAADQAYTLSLTTADNNQLSIATGKISIEAEGTPIYFVAQDNDTYALSNGTEYAVYKGGDNWSLTASADAYGWTIAPVEGGYTITGKNGFLGTNANDKAAGTTCYGDKKANNGNYIWAITEYVEPLTPANVAAVLNEENKSIDVVSDNAEFPLQVKTKLASQFEEGETPESIANDEVEQMNDAFATEEEFIEYFAAYATKESKEVSIDGIEEAFPGEQYVVFGYNVAWDKKEGKIVLASNVASYTYDIPEPEPEPVYVGTPLTSDMFHDWSAPGADAVVTNEKAYCENKIGEDAAAGSVIYGNGSVLGQSFADLSDYDYLVLNGVEGAGAPRVLLNVVGQSDPKTFIELNGADDAYYTKSEDGKTWTIDLNAIKANYPEYVHLNCIKASWGGGVKIGSIELLSAFELGEPVFNVNDEETISASETITVSFPDVNVTADDNYSVEIEYYINKVEGEVSNAQNRADGEGNMTVEGNVCDDIELENLNLEDGNKYEIGVVKATVYDASGAKVYTSDLTNNPNKVTVIVDSETATAIGGIGNGAAKANGKYLINGKIVIIRNGIKFNAAGATIK